VSIEEKMDIYSKTKTMIADIHKALDVIATFWPKDLDKEKAYLIVEHDLICKAIELQSEKND